MALFARENEVKSVCALLAGRGTGGALVLRGEAGVGKSALLNEVISAGQRTDVRVLATAGVSLQMQQPFAGLAHLMRSVLNDPALSDRRPDAWDTVRSAVGGQDVPIGNPFNVAYAVLEVLSACATKQGLLLVVDDAGWIDEQSWRVLSFIGRRIGFDQIALVMAMRDGVETDRRLGDSFLPTLRIEPLPDEAAAALLDRVAPALHPRIRAWILREAGGNPLGLLELSDEARRRGSAAMSGTAIPLPARLEQTYAGLVSELPDATRSLLLTAAFNDSHSLQETLDAAAAAFDRRITLDELEPAISARLVSVENGFELRFRHPLVCSALRQLATVSDRCRAHLAFAEVLRDDPERSIWHRAAATVGKDDELARELASTARRARQRGDVATAVSALERSAQLTVDESSGASRLLWAALSAAEMGDAGTVERLVHTVGGVRLTGSAPARLAWLQETYLGAPWSGSIRLRTLLDVVDEMRLAGEVDLALDSLVVMSLRAWWSAPDLEIRELIAAMAQSLDESLTDLRAVYVIAVVAPLERGSWALGRLTDLAGAVETGPERLHLLASAATCLGAVGLSNVLHAEAVAGLRRQGRLGTLARALAGQAWAAVLLGDARLALTASSEARALGEETGYRSYALVADLSRAAALALRGETAAAADVLEGAESALVPVGRQALFPMLQLARGLSALASGHPDDAFEQLVRIFSARDAGFHPSQKFAALAHLAEAAAKSGQLDRLRPIVAELTPVAAATKSPALVMSLAYAEALLAPDAAAGESLRCALEADLSAWPFERARLQVAYGARLRHGRRRRDSRSYLRAAGETFDALGARRWADWAWQELRASGETVRRAEDPAARLSPQEFQVATMAAQGLTNRQIASQLFLSPRTVSTHLYRIYPKVGVTTRHELHRALGGRPAAELPPLDTSGDVREIAPGRLTVLPSTRRATSSARRSDMTDPKTPVLEPAAQAFAEATAGPPFTYELPVEVSRKGLEDLQSSDDLKPAADVTDVIVNTGGTGRVKVRIVTPPGSLGPLPVVLYTHGAGWVLGSPDTHERLARDLAVGANVAVVLPHYDRSPEAKYPTAVEQCWAVAKWIVGDGSEHNLDASSMVIAGDSCGGNIAAALTFLAKQRGGVSFAAQVLFYPVTDADFDTGSYTQFAEGYFLRRDNMMWFWDQYTTDPAKRAEITAAPLNATLKDLEGLPPTLIINGEADVLRDEGEAYGDKLRAAGVPVTAVRYAGMIHDFVMLDTLRKTYAAEAAIAHAAAFISAAVRSG